MKKGKVLGNFSAIEALGITFALSAGALGEVGYMFYHSVERSLVIELLIRHVIRLALWGVIFSVAVTCLSLGLSKLFKYDITGNHLAFGTKTAFFTAIFSVLFALPVIMLFVGGAMFGFYFERTVIYLISEGIVLVAFSLSGLIRGARCGKKGREFLVGALIGLIVVLISLPLALVNSEIVALILSVLVATAFRVAVSRVITLNKRYAK